MCNVTHAMLRSCLTQRNSGKVAPAPSPEAEVFRPSAGIAATELVERLDTIRVNKDAAYGARIRPGPVTG